MKKFAILLFLSASSLFISCSNDDDDTIVIDESLIPGEWSLTEIRSEDGRVTTTIQGVPVSGSYDLTGKDYTAQVTFTEVSGTDPNTFTSSGGFTLVATVSIPTQSIDYEEAIPDFIGNGEWSVEGNTLTTSAQGQEQSFEIIALSAQTMSLKATIDETVEQQGFTFEATGSQIFTLTKN
ncbi:lipocalin family protein [Aquimarina sp. 2201CG5-10]|uniref:lipocalin family protein n=1 Tax=Aquimarina callyspongiae TaxID=3098150 RepID=UPI002AB4B1C0|nr:lipocalin family protein [Aquimarina sp. 2201CG5-10]MDY8136527.1 lipocalin family protein [Aquimarina sp. 2201CG5-10]